VGATRARAAREYKQPELRKEIERLRDQITELKAELAIACGQRRAEL
jgi:hypothetical protein